MNYPRMLAFAIACATATSPMLAIDAGAQVRAEIRKTVEATMVLTGTVDISPAGAVEAFHLDKVDQVEASAAQSAQSLVKGWRFEPVIRDGKAVPARVPVRMRLLAQQMADGGASISVTSARFDGEAEEGSSDRPRKRKMLPPTYPMTAFQMGATGELTLLVQIGRDGLVKQVAVEQVNLRVLMPEPQMRRVRDLFARSSIDAAKRWEFTPPTTGDRVHEASWTVRVPVNYLHHQERGERYGRWQAYVPGPKSPAEWNYNGKGSAEDNGDLLAEGGVYLAGVSNGPKLLTPLGG